MDKPTAKAAAEYWLSCQHTWRLAQDKGDALLAVVSPGGYYTHFPLEKA